MDVLQLGVDSLEMGIHLLKTLIVPLQASINLLECLVRARCICATSWSSRLPYIRQFTGFFSISQELFWQSAVRYIWHLTRMSAR